MSQQMRFSEMGNSFEINKIKSTQRERYSDFLFKKLDVKDKNILLVDDALFSGSTLDAALISLKEARSITIFTLFKNINIWLK